MQDTGKGASSLEGAPTVPWCEASDEMHVRLEAGYGVADGDLRRRPCEGNTAATTPEGVHQIRSFQTLHDLLHVGEGKTV